MFERLGGTWAVRDIDGQGFVLEEVERRWGEAKAVRDGGSVTCAEAGCGREGGKSAGSPIRKVA